MRFVLLLLIVVVAFVDAYACVKVLSIWVEWKSLPEAVPRELWTPFAMLASGTITAIVALSAVAIQNLSAERRHRDQLHHDAMQRQLEREAQLRKEVLLEAMDGVNLLSVALHEMWNVKVPYRNVVNSLKKARRSLAKASLVCGKETSDAFATVGKEMFDILPEALKVRNSYSDVDLAVDQIRRAFKRAVAKRNDISSRLSAEVKLTEGESLALKDDLRRSQDVVDKLMKQLGESEVDLADMANKISVKGHELSDKLGSTPLSRTVELRFFPAA